METKEKMQKYRKNKQFKSYYVVWKLPSLTTLCFNIVGFKSYYVVWKRIVDPPDVEKKEEFKSYYVVWKHTYISEEEKTKLLV